MNEMEASEGQLRLFAPNDRHQGVERLLSKLIMLVSQATDNSEFVNTIEEYRKIIIRKVVRFKVEICRYVWEVGECDAECLAQTVVQLIALQINALVFDAQQQRQSDDEILLTLLDETSLSLLYIDVLRAC